MGSLVARLDGWLPRELDLGGGFPAPRDPLRRAPGDDGSLEPVAPPIEDIAEVIAAELADGLSAAGVSPHGLVLQVEPGRSLHADTGIHLTTIRGIKHVSLATEHTWIETDTSEQFLLDTLIEGNRWPVVVTARADAPRTARADIVGCSCGFDVLVEDASLPEVAPGDILALLDTGAYQESLATNFTALPRPATVLVSGDRSEVIRRREREDEVFRRDVVPARLGGTASGSVARTIDHVSVTCTSIERSLTFYRDGLGLAVLQRGAETDERIGAVLALPGARLRFADLALGDGTVVELLEYQIAARSRAQTSAQRPRSRARGTRRRRHRRSARTPAHPRLPEPLIAHIAQRPRRQMERRQDRLRPRSGRLHHRADPTTRRRQTRLTLPSRMPQPREAVA